ncbi:MAG: N-acetyltransferase family protein [Actinomycetota bacterium]
MIRRLTSDDAPLLREIRILAITDAPDAFGSTLEETEQRSFPVWEQILRPDGNPFFIYEQNGGVVGLIGALNPNESGVAHLVSMWVATHGRGSGVSDELVAHVIAWASDSGSHRLELSCTEGNLHAERLYMRHGFLRTGEFETRQRDGKIEFVMALALSPASGR